MDDGLPAAARNLGSRADTTTVAMVASAKISFLSEIYLRYGEALGRFLSSRRLNRQEVEDVTQESYLRICALEDPRVLDNPRAFLFTTAANLAVDLQRKQGVRRRGLNTHDNDSDFITEIEGIASTAPTPEAIASDRERLRLLEQCIRALPPKRRMAFVLHRFHGHTYKGIAAVMGISVAAVEKHIMRALACCEKALEDRTKPVTGKQVRP